MSDVEKRLRRLEDRAELQDLVVRYFVACDDDDYPTIGTCFTDDAVFVAGSFTGGTTRDEVVEFIRADREAAGGPTVHTHNYTLFEFEDDDSATGLVGAHLELGRGGTTVYAAVRYVDRYARVDGTWQISHRQMLAIHVGPWSEVGTSLTSELRVRWPGLDPQPADLPVKN